MNPNNNEPKIDPNQPINPEYVNQERIARIQDEARRMSREVATKSIREVQDLKSNLERKYKYLNEQVPKLFEIIMEKRFDRNNFEFMINSLTRLINGQNNMHEENVNIGTMLVNKYVKPNLEKKGGK
jgi:hypothetical protein